MGYDFALSRFLIFLLAGEILALVSAAVVPRGWHLFLAHIVTVLVAGICAGAVRGFQPALTTPMRQALLVWALALPVVAALVFLLQPS